MTLFHNIYNEAAPEALNIESDGFVQNVNHPRAFSWSNSINKQSHQLKIAFHVRRVKQTHDLTKKLLTGAPMIHSHDFAFGRKRIIETARAFFTAPIEINDRSQLKKMEDSGRFKITFSSSQAEVGRFRDS